MAFRRKNWLRTNVFIMIFLIIMAMVVPANVQAQDDQGNQTYVVQAGDNLYRIAQRYGTTVSAIVTANSITNPNLIYVGQVLVIPSGSTPPTTPPPTTPPTTNPPPPTTGTSTYTVQRGDNLSRIAQRFGTTVSAIVAINSIANPSLIYAGQVLNIPGGGGVANPPTTTPPSNPVTNPPVSTPGASGGFELGGHITDFGRVNEMRNSSMTWAKKQIRWNRGEGVESAAAAINEARANGFKILLGIVGFPNQMGDYDAYTNEFAAYLGEVAKLGPDAIEVWNEPNIDREWPSGQVDGGRYTIMLSKAYNAIKTANPNVMVISGAPAPTGFFGGGCSTAGCDDNVFLRQMRNANAQNYMDCIGAHYNEGIISPDQRSGDPRGSHYTRYFYGMLDLYSNTFGGARKVCWTELGYLSPDGLGQLPANFAWAQNTTVAQHAEWLGRAVSLSRSSGRVRLMIIWNVNFSGIQGGDPMGGYAIVRPDGSCPACATLAAAMR